MAYRNALGEFIVDQSRGDWPNTIRWIERPPILVRGGMNPWEMERSRVLWLKEKEAWSKIIPLKDEYAKKEQEMKRLIDVFNAHLAELERVAGKKVGIGPIGSYGGMALAILPGFGWAAAAFSAVSMIFDMIGGNKKKKRMNELIQIMERTEAKIRVIKQRMIAIMNELQILMGVTERIQQEQRLATQRDIINQQALVLSKKKREKQAAMEHEQEVMNIRQRLPFQLQYTRSVDL